MPVQGEEVRISVDALTRNVRERHSDLLGTRTFQDGSFNEIANNSEYYELLDSWGLSDPEPQVRGNPNNPSFFFKISNIGKYENSGLC